MLINYLIDFILGYELPQSQNNWVLQDGYKNFQA